MKLRVLLVLLVGGIAGPDAKDDAVKKELEKLKGAYTMVSGEEDGKALPADFVKGSKFEFTADKMTITTGKDKVVAALKIDPSGKVKQFDLMPEAGPDKGKTIKGIYVLDGDTLKLSAASDASKGRPTDFTTKKGSGNVLMVLKKEKK